MYTHVGALLDQYTDLKEQGEMTGELSAIQLTPLSGTFHNPAPSCQTLPAASQSGYLCQLCRTWMDEEEKHTGITVKDRASPSVVD